MRFWILTDGQSEDGRGTPKPRYWTDRADMAGAWEDRCRANPYCIGGAVRYVVDELRAGDLADDNQNWDG